MRRKSPVHASFSSRLMLAASLAAMAAATPLHGQTAQQHVRRGVVTDWTKHHLVHSYTGDFATLAKLQNDPRWVNEWYLRHPQLWWQGNRQANTKAGSSANATDRDWNVVLGSITFDPIFDLTYSLGNETGQITVNTTDELNGTYLASAGYLTTGGNSYNLYPGGPSATTLNSLFGNTTYDNLLSPAANPVVDTHGLLFYDKYGFYDQLSSTGSSAYTITGDVIGFTYSTGTGSDVTLAAAPGGGITFPAKYVFDVTAAPSCANDYVAIGIPAYATSGGQANIVGYNNIYSNSAGTGLCSTVTSPTVRFAYASGSGEVPSDISLSQDGTKLAYIENEATSSYFHVLTIGTTGSNGTSPTGAVTPGSGNNATDVSVALTPDGVTTENSTTAPFIVYTPNDTADVAYATTYSRSGTGSGYVFKISNVFSGTPTITWSVAVDAVPSSPVYDSVSNKVFFTDSSGRTDYILDSGTSPSITYGTVEGLGATSVNAPVVDSTNGMVYSTFNMNSTNTATSNAIVVQQTTAGKSPVVVPIGTGSTTYQAPYEPDFNNAFYTGTGTPEMYIVGTGSGTVPTLYRIGFSGTTLSSSATGNGVTLASGAADSAPVTEFYNATTGQDYLFLSVTNHCVATTAGGTAGCVISLSLGNGSPTVNKNTTALPASGGTTGIIVDNDSSESQASSIYYGTKISGTLVKATQSGLD